MLVAKDIIAIYFDLISLKRYFSHPENPGTDRHKILALKCLVAGEFSSQQCI